MNVRERIQKALSIQPRGMTTLELWHAAGAKMAPVEFHGLLGKMASDHQIDREATPNGLFAVWVPKIRGRPIELAVTEMLIPRGPDGAGLTQLVNDVTGELKMDRGIVSAAVRATVSQMIDTWDVEVVPGSEPQKYRLVDKASKAGWAAHRIAKTKQLLRDLWRFEGEEDDKFTLEDAMVDMVVNLRHVADAESIQWPEVEVRVADHYEDERGET